MASKDPAKLAREARLASKGERGRGCSDGETEQVVFSFFKLQSSAIHIIYIYMYAYILLQIYIYIYIYMERERLMDASGLVPGGSKNDSESDFAGFCIISDSKSASHGWRHPLKASAADGNLHQPSWPGLLSRSSAPSEEKVVENLGYWDLFLDENQNVHVHHTSGYVFLHVLNLRSPDRETPRSARAGRLDRGTFVRNPADFNPGNSGHVT